MLCFIVEKAIHCFNGRSFLIYLTVVLIKLQNIDRNIDNYFSRLWFSRNSIQKVRAETERRLERRQERSPLIFSFQILFLSHAHVFVVSNLDQLGRGATGRGTQTEISIRDVPIQSQNALRP